MIFLLLLILVLSLIKGLYLTYIFQIKEYRFDRLFSLIKERGLVHTIYIHESHLPARSLRNILIFFILICLVMLTALIAIEISWIYYGLIFGFFLVPFLSFIFVLFAVLLTDVPSRIVRYIIILKAQHKVKKSTAIFIGITGSYAKSSVKEYLYSVLSTSYLVGKTDKNMNTEVGIALSLLRNLKEDTQIFIVELGAYKVGEIAHAAWYIPFQKIILTGLGNQHVDLYGSRENLIREESWPLTRTTQQGIVYAPADQYEQWKIIEPEIKGSVVTFGTHQAHIKSRIITQSPGNTSFTVSYRRHILNLRTQLPGKHSVSNLLPVIACALDMNVAKEKITTVIGALKPIVGKLSLHTGKNGCLFLHDGINSNVDGCMAAIEVLNSYASLKKIMITQGIIELGKEKRGSYEKIIRKLQETNIQLFSTDPLFQLIDNKKQTMIFNDVSSLIEHLNTIPIDRKNIVLIEGKFPSHIIHQLIGKRGEDEH